MDTATYLEFIWEKLRLAKKGTYASTSMGGGDHSEPLSEYCLEPEWNAVLNPWDQTPCEVARILIDQCSNQQPVYYDLPLLHGQNRYPIPFAGQATNCVCNVPVYNLLQACGACQQPNVTESMPWGEYKANCDNAFRTYPLPCPATTTIPDWAFQDTSQGALDVFFLMQLYNQSHSAQQQKSSSSSASLAASTSATTSLPASTAATAAPTPSGDAQAHTSPIPQPKNGPSHTIGITVSLVVAGAIAAGIAAAVAIFLRRKRRLRRQGTRLGSSSDLTYNDEMVEKKPPGSSFATLSTRGGGGGELKADDISIFVPTEDLRSDRSRAGGGSRHSTRSSRTGASSFVTNSSSTSQSHEFRQYLRETAATAPSFTTYSLSNSGSSITSSSVADTETSSSSHTHGEGDGESESGDDASLSPFADIHRAPSIRTLDSHLSIPASLHIPRTRVVVPRAYAPDVRDSMATTISIGSVRESEGEEGDARSLAPSSTGAVYGGEEGESENGSERGSTRSGRSSRR